MKLYLAAAAALLLSATPERLAAGHADKHEVTVAVFSINDFHGAFVRNDDKDIPGAPAVWQTLDSLKRVYPLHVTVAAGDNFGGSYFYNATKGILLPVLFNGMDIRLSAIGNHEFDDGQTALGNKWNGSPLRPDGWNLDYVCANVRNASGRIPDFARPCASLVIPIGKKDSLRIGFVGLLTASTPQQASASKLAGLTFDGDYSAVLDSVKRLPEYAMTVGHADIRLLLTHIGTMMQNGVPAWNDVDSANLAGIDDDTWHGILSAHSHEPVVGIINARHYPVVQGKWHGEYISVMKIRFNTQTRTVVGVKSELCPVSPDIKLGDGPAHLQALTDSLLKATKTKGGTPIGQRLTTAGHTLVHDRSDKHRQTLMGTLVCRAYAEACRKSLSLPDTAVIVGVSHFGSIRAGFTKGAVSVLDVGEALPFSNAIRIYRLTGEQLRELVDFGLHNERYGWLQTSWLTIRTNDEGHVDRLTYAGPGGESVTITDTTPCLLAADAFITTGGDGYSPVFFPAARELHVHGLPATTDAFIDYLKTLPEIPDK